MRILVFCEHLRPPFDEGIRNTALQFIRALSREHDVLGLTNLGASVPQERVERVAANRLLLSPALARTVRAFRPELVLHFPTACATPFAFWRGRMLGLYARAPVVLAILQPRRQPPYARPLLRLLRPRLCLAPSERLAAALEGLGSRVRPLGVGVDVERFRPADADRRRALRRAYGLAEQAYVVLHVGHLKAARGVQALAPLQGVDGTQVVLVGSASLGVERDLVAGLEARGVRVITGYLPDVAEVFQLADCYAFPVRAEENAIELPLSVLEAMACNLPVVSTPYGGLPERFPQGGGLWYEAAEEGLRARILCVRGQSAATRERVLPLAWERVVSATLDDLRRALSLSP